MGKKASKTEIVYENEPDVGQMWQTLYELLADQEGWASRMVCCARPEQKKR